MIRLDTQLPGHAPAHTAGDGAREKSEGSPDFARALDVLGDAWYRCASTPLADAVRSVLPARVSAATPGAADEPPPASAVARATAGSDAARAAATTAAPPNGPDNPNGSDDTNGVRPSMAPAASTLPIHASPQLAFIHSVARAETPMPETSLRPAVATNTHTSVAMPRVTRDAVRHATGPDAPAESAAAAGARRPPADSALAAAPAALVMTVLQSGEGRRTLAMRCPPVLRDTALALARHWYDSQRQQVSAGPAEPEPLIVLNGGVIPAFNRRS